MVGRSGGGGSGEGSRWGRESGEGVEAVAVGEWDVGMAEKPRAKVKHFHPWYCTMGSFQSQK